MSKRTETSFYAIWKDGMEWPELFADLAMARERAHLMAKDSPGQDVHLMKLLSQGVVRYSDRPEKQTGLTEINRATP